MNRFRVRAVGMGRSGGISPIGLTGVVQASADAAVWLRPGLAEEYTVSSEGVRQDFVVAARPAGAGQLVVELEVAGAWAQEAAYGATLTLDATGRELSARLEVPATDRLRVVVEDAGAALHEDVNRGMRIDAPARRDKTSARCRATVSPALKPNSTGWWPRSRRISPTTRRRVTTRRACDRNS